MIKELQAAMLDLPQVEIKTKHYFCNGVYAREITIPAGVLIAGAEHKTEHFHIVSKGRCEIVNFGEKETVEAPYTGVTKPGSKRAILALKETVFTTFHPTHEKDINKIEKEILEPEGLKIANNPEVQLCHG